MAESTETVQEDRIDFVISNAELALKTIDQIVYNLELEEQWNKRERWFSDVMGSSGTI